MYFDVSSEKDSATTLHNLKLTGRLEVLTHVSGFCRDSEPSNLGFLFHIYFSHACSNFYKFQLSRKETSLTKQEHEIRPSLVADW
jgi:hypothetical protein